MYIHVAHVPGMSCVHEYTRMYIHVYMNTCTHHIPPRILYIRYMTYDMYSFNRNMSSTCSIIYVMHVVYVHMNVCVYTYTQGTFEKETRVPGFISARSLVQWYTQPFDRIWKCFRGIRCDLLCQYWDPRLSCPWTIHRPNDQFRVAIAH